MTVACWKRRSCAALLVLLAACGRADRLGLQGSVTLDGEPLPQGVIQFVPLPGTKGPSAGSTIRDGQFSVEPDKGVFPGTFRVEITASRKTGRKLIDRQSGQVTDELGNVLPARYNQNSELTKEVTADGPNAFDFALQSK